MLAEITILGIYRQARFIHDAQSICNLAQVLMRKKFDTALRLLYGTAFL